jgi:hypothetical protein
LPNGTINSRRKELSAPTALRKMKGVVASAAVALQRQTTVSEAIEYAAQQLV